MKCIAMYSGGLDSTIAVHLMLRQGIEVLAVHFLLPFFCGVGEKKLPVIEYAKHLGVHLRIEEDKEEFLKILKNPLFGYGRNANPCIDCRIYRFKRAAQIMAETGAKFIVSGEVLGQRPMSQRRDAIYKIENMSGLKGLILRPLSAKLLNITIAEQNGWVDRDKLMAIRGRGRSQQLIYAKTFGLKHGAPAGGCILTNEATAARFNDLKNYCADFNFNDLKLIAYGRHFRLSPSVKLVVSRNDYENNVLESLYLTEDYKLELVDCPGPIGLLRGEYSAENIEIASSIMARYCRLRNEPLVRVKVEKENFYKIIEQKPAGDDLCSNFRI